MKSSNLPEPTPKPIAQSVAIDHLLGIPYDYGCRTMQSCDCWGLVRLYYKSILDYRLPSFDRFYSACRSHTNILIEVVNELQADSSLQKVSIARPHTILLGAKPNTFGFGVAIGDGKILHTRFRRRSSLTDWETWKNNYESTNFYEPSNLDLEEFRNFG